MDNLEIVKRFYDETFNMNGIDLIATKLNLKFVNVTSTDTLSQMTKC